VPDFPPDWIPEDPDGHRWVTPASPDCPNCECCSSFLCDTAKERDSSCHWVGNPGPGVMDLRRCPCAPLLPPSEVPGD